MTDDGGAAFPRPIVPVSIAPENSRDGKWSYHDDGADGMSLRDYFAAKAMQGSLARDISWGSEELATQAYDYAEAMLAESKRRKEKSDGG